MKDENESLQELKEALMGLSQTVGLAKKALEAQVKVDEGKFRSVDEALLHRSIEDGVIANLDKANETQIEMILRKELNFFKYYEEVYRDPVFFKIK